MSLLEILLSPSQFFMMNVGTFFVLVLVEHLKQSRSCGIRISFIIIDPSDFVGLLSHSRWKNYWGLNVDFSFQVSIEHILIRLYLHVKYRLINIKWISWDMDVESSSILLWSWSSPIFRNQVLGTGTHPPPKGFWGDPFKFLRSWYQSKDLETRISDLFLYTSNSFSIDFYMRSKLWVSAHFFHKLGKSKINVYFGNWRNDDTNVGLT